MRKTSNPQNSWLPRLSEASYRGQAYVHWISTIEKRKTGWLCPILYCKFREVLTHAAFRYAVVCPIYCLMPDHIHMVWIGIDDQTDQLIAMKYWRKWMGGTLEKIGYEFQYQAFDHVLNENERQEQAFESLVEYVARNPERKGLVPIDQFKAYPYTGSLIPGYPELDFRLNDYWTRFWRCYSFLRKHGLIQTQFGRKKSNLESDPKRPR